MVTQRHWQLPAKPGPNPGRIRCWNLTQLFGQNDWGSMRLFDLSPNSGLTIEEAYPGLLETIVGSATCAVAGLDYLIKERQAGPVPNGQITIDNPSAHQPIRVLLVQQHQPSTAPIVPQFRDIADFPVSPRPGRFELRSLWEAAGLGRGESSSSDIGYESVIINELVRRHRHQGTADDEPGSLAVVLVIGGEGEYGIATDDGPGLVLPIGPGSVVCSAENEWHGFKPKPGQSLVIGSGQSTSIQHKYQFAADQDIPEFSYTI